ncbi:MAG: AAA family ATPase, partial [Megasphaera lornae]
MKITGVRLFNFRNYKNMELNFHNMIHIFYGNNGQGKTNLLESLY